MCIGGPKCGGSVASNNVNASSVESAVALTVIRKPPRSIGRPSPGCNTNASVAIIILPKTTVIMPDGLEPDRHVEAASGCLCDLGDSLVRQSQKLGNIPIADTRLHERPDGIVPPLAVHLCARHGRPGLLDRPGQVSQTDIPVDDELVRLQLEPQGHNLDPVALGLGQGSPEGVCPRGTYHVDQPGRAIFRIAANHDLESPLATHSHHLSPGHGASVDRMSLQVPGGRSLECIGMTVRHFPHCTITCEPRWRRTTQLNLRLVSSRTSARLVICLEY